MFYILFVGYTCVVRGGGPFLWFEKPAFLQPAQGKLHDMAAAANLSLAFQAKRCGCAVMWMVAPCVRRLGKVLCGLES